MRKGGGRNDREGIGEEEKMGEERGRREEEPEKGTI